MSRDKEIYDEISELFKKLNQAYQEHIRSILGVMNDFIFSAAPADEKEIVSLIQSDVLVFEDMLAGYINSFLGSRKITNNYNVYLKKHKFYSEEHLNKLKKNLNEEEIFYLSEYLKEMDKMKYLYESLL